MDHKDLGNHLVCHIRYLQSLLRKTIGTYLLRHISEVQVDKRDSKMTMVTRRKDHDRGEGSVEVVVGEEVEVGVAVEENRTTVLIGNRVVRLMC